MSEFCTCNEPHKVEELYDADARVFAAAPFRVNVGSLHSNDQSEKYRTCNNITTDVPLLHVHETAVLCQILTKIPSTPLTSK